MNVKLLTLTEMDAVRQALYDREMFEYVSAILSYVSGIVLTLIVVAVSLMLIVDTIYLIFPNAKYVYDNYKMAQKGKLGKIVTHFLVSKNAIEAFEDSSVTGQPVMWCYLKRAIKFYIIVVSIVYVLAAGLDIILVVVYKLISGFLR